VAKTSLGHQRQPVRRLRCGLLQLMESANRKCFIAAPETVPGRRTCGIEVLQLPVFLRCFRIALERKQCARKHEPRLLMIRLQTQDCPERLDSFESIAELQARSAKEEIGRASCREREERAEGE